MGLEADTELNKYEINLVVCNRNEVKVEQFGDIILKLKSDFCLELQAIFSTSTRWTSISLPRLVSWVLTCLFVMVC